MDRTNQITVRLQDTVSIVDAAILRKHAENPSQLVRTALREYAQKHGIAVVAECTP